MKKHYLLIYLFSLLIFNSNAQDFCNGDHFFDSGGLNGNYQDNEDITTLITPNAGDAVQVTFLSFDVEENFDFLSVFNGPDNTAPLLGVFDGTNLPGPFSSTHATGSLTFVFTSDNTVTRPGWQAVVQCQSVSCAVPTDVVFSNIIPNSVKLNWTDNNSPTSISWEIEYGPVGFAIGTGTRLQTTTNPTEINNLNLGSNDVYIRSNCGVNPNEDDSFWAGPFKVLIACETILLAPLTEDFTLNTIPECWEQTGSETWNFSLDAAFDANQAGDHTLGGNTNYAWIDGSDPNGNGHISNLFSPWVDVSNLTVPSINFSVFSVNTNSKSYNTLDVILHEQSGNSISLLNLQQDTNGWLDYSFSPILTDHIIRIEFIIEENANTPFFNDILIDDFSIIESPTCPKPNNLSNNNPLPNSIDLNWANGNTETTWEIQYGTSGFVLGNGTTLVINTNPYTLTGLNSQTEYDVYIRAICGNNLGEDDSLWLGPTTFTTLLNYCNGDHFLDSGGLTGDYSNNEDITTIVASQGDEIVTVTFLSFNLENNFDFLTVFDGPNNTFPNLGAFSGITIPGPFTSTHPSGDLTFVFTSDSSQVRSGWDALVTCESNTCPRPTNFTANLVTPTSVEFGWTPGDTETNWEIEYGPFGFNQGTGTIVSVNTNPFTINDLDQGTRQDFYIRAICGSSPGQDDSSWSNVTTVSTPCGVFSTPFIENFDSENTPGCWFEFGSETWNFNTDASFSAATAGDNSSAGNTNYAWIDGSGPTGEGQISNLITPWIDITNIIQPVIRFYIYSKNDNDQTYNTLDVILHQQGGNDIELLHLQDQTTNGWQEFVFINNQNINITENQIQLEFIIEENSTGSAFYNDILIDDVIVEEGQVIGINDNILENINFYPNPVKDLLTIKTEALINKITLYDLLGKKVISQKVNNKNIATIETIKLNKGVYFVHVLADNKTKTFKIIKK